jgi:hypothetical protein
MALIGCDQIGREQTGGEWIGLLEWTGSDVIGVDRQ